MGALCEWCACVHVRVGIVYHAAESCVAASTSTRVCSCVFVCICVSMDVCLCTRRVCVSSEYAGMVCVHMQEACETCMHIVQGVCEILVLAPGSTEPPCLAPLALDLLPGGPRGPRCLDTCGHRPHCPLPTPRPHKASSPLTCIPPPWGAREQTWPCSVGSSLG